jgi:hypothetical protein
MSANEAMRDNELVNAAVVWLRERIPSTWVVDRARRGEQDPREGVAATVDGVIELRSPNGVYTTIAVEARGSLEPREVDRLLPGLARSLRALAGNVPLLVVAPWLSARAQALLASEDINFLDLTGNALLKLDNPAVFIQAVGAPRNPNPAARGPASIRGPKAGRLVRLLADVRPPYGVRELASTAGLTAGYVSRLLDALDRDAIVERGPRGVVQDVDIAALLRAWAADYDVFKREAVSSFVAPKGAADALDQLAAVRAATLVTGSFAAVRLAPIAAPSMLVVYCQDVAATAASLGLLPAEEGANVTLLRAFDEVAWARASSADGVGYAAPSQVVVDCLSGNGRMPAEGEAVLAWMIEHEDQWRMASLPDAASTLAT